MCRGAISKRGKVYRECMGPPLETPLSFIDSAGGTHTLSIHLSPLATATATSTPKRSTRKRVGFLYRLRRNVNTKKVYTQACRLFIPPTAERQHHHRKIGENVSMIVVSCSPEARLASV